MFRSRECRVEEHIDIIALDQGVERGGQDFVLEPKPGKDQDRSICGDEGVDETLMRPWGAVLLDHKLAWRWSDADVPRQRYAVLRGIAR